MYISLEWWCAVRCIWFAWFDIQTYNTWFAPIVRIHCWQRHLRTRACMCIVYIRSCCWAGRRARGHSVTLYITSFNMWTDNLIGAIAIAYDAFGMSRMTCQHTTDISYLHLHAYFTRTLREYTQSPDTGEWIFFGTASKGTKCKYDANDQSHLQSPRLTGTMIEMCSRCESWHCSDWRLSIIIIIAMQHAVLHATIVYLMFSHAFLCMFHVILIVEMDFCCACHIPWQPWNKYQTLQNYDDEVAVRSHAIFVKWLPHTSTKQWIFIILQFAWTQFVRKSFCFRKTISILKIYHCLWFYFLFIRTSSFSTTETITLCVYTWCATWACQIQQIAITVITYIQVIRLRQDIMSLLSVDNTKQKKN